MKLSNISKISLFILLGTPVATTTLNADAVNNNDQYSTPQNPDLRNIYESFTTTENLTMIINDLGQGVHLFGEGSKFNLKKPADHFAKALLNICGLGKGSIKLLDKDFETLKKYYSCVILPDESLKSEARIKDDTSLTCKPIHCVSKQSCIGVTLGKTSEILSPFVQNLLGKVVDIQNEDSEKPSYTVQAGLLTNFNQLTSDVIELAIATKLPAKFLGKNGELFLDKMREKLKKLEVVQNTLAILSHDILTILTTMAPLLGGKEYLDTLPEISEEQRSQLLSEQISIDSSVLDELNFDDFID